MEHLRRIHWILFLLLLVQTSFAATYDICGVVQDAKSGEALPFANIMVQDTHRGTTTNTDGYFVLVNEPVGPCTLNVQYIGYNTKNVPFLNKLDSKALLNIDLEPAVLVMEGVTVTAAAEMMDASSGEVGQVSISPRQIARLPNIGEVDVFRSIQLLPGISGASDGESGLYVRGGTPDQNLVLFDGMTIYHVDHFFGFFSAFNADAIKDVQVYKGGFPSEYGGRISSVVNLTGKTGNQNKRQFGFGINLLSMHSHVEVPLGKFGNLLIAGRRSYTDIIRSPLYDSIYELMTGEEAIGMGGGMRGGGRRGGMMATEFQPAFYFYDFNTKLTLNPSEKDIVTFSFYSGKDNLDKSQDFSDMNMKVEGSDASLSTTDFNRWGNLGTSGKWSRQWNSRLHSVLLVAWSEYFSEYDRDMNMNVVFQTPNDSLNSGRGFSNSRKEDNSVGDLTARIDLTWNLSSTHALKFGSWLSDFKSEYTTTMNDTTSLLDLQDNARLAAFYVQDHWRIGAAELLPGLRLSHYGVTGTWYTEPRFSVSLPIIQNVTLKGAWGHYRQFVNRIVNENVLEGSRDFWILSGNDLEPAFSEHWIAGLDYETSQYLLSAEVYSKSLENLVEYSRRFTGRASYAEYFFTGDGESRGIELLAQKKRGALTGWIGYTLAKVDHTFPAFNEGQSFPADYDRRHELNVVSKYMLGAWTFAATGVFATGKAYTAPESEYNIELLDGEEISYIHVGEKNSYRLPDYFRCDVSVSRLFEFDYWRTELGLSIFNVTNHKNVWYCEYNLDTSPVTVSDALMLGFTPTLYVQFNFK